MSFTTVVQPVINEDDLTTPSSAINPNYLLGQVYSFKDSSNSAAVKQFMYVKANGALTAYVPYRIVASGTAGAEWTTAAPITLTASVSLIGIPQVAFTSGYYGFIQIAGAATYATGSLAIVATYAVKVLTAGVTLVTDTTTAVQSNVSVGFNVSTTTTGDTTGTVILQGARVVVTS